MPIGFAIALVVGSVMADRRLSGLETEVSLLRKEIAAVTVNTDPDSLLRVRTFVLWCELCAAKNPQLLIPSLPR